MEKVAGPVRVTLPNAWGQDDTSTRTLERVTGSDVGKSVPDYGGHHRPARLIMASDVGRLVERITYPGQTYHSWFFCSLVPNWYPPESMVENLNSDK